MENENKAVLELSRALVECMEGRADSGMDVRDVRDVMAAVSLAGATWFLAISSDRAASKPAFISGMSGTFDAVASTLVDPELH